NPAAALRRHGRSSRRVRPASWSAMRSKGGCNLQGRRPMRVAIPDRAQRTNTCGNRSSGDRIEPAEIDCTGKDEVRSWQRHVDFGITKSMNWRELGLKWALTEWSGFDVALRCMQDQAFSALAESQVEFLALDFGFPRHRANTDRLRPTLEFAGLDRQLQRLRS